MRWEHREGHYQMPNNRDDTARTVILRCRCWASVEAQ